MSNAARADGAAEASVDDAVVFADADASDFSCRCAQCAGPTPLATEMHFALRARSLAVRAADASIAAAPEKLRSPTDPCWTHGTQGKFEQVKQFSTSAKTPFEVHTFQVVTEV